MILVQIKECILLLKFFFYELDPFNVIQKKKKRAAYLFALHFVTKISISIHFGVFTLVK